jgi:hypothetical protein
MKRDCAIRFCGSAFLFVIVVVTFLVFTPSLFAQKVKFDYDKATDFLRLKSYAWVRGTLAPNPNMDTHITFLAEAMLEKKGRRKVAVKEGRHSGGISRCLRRKSKSERLRRPSFIAVGGIPV